MGIKAEAIARIFDPFEQADGSTTRKYGGTGLGLTISRTLVTLMGGTIRVESQHDRGSTFHFTNRFRRQQHSDSGSRPLGDARMRGVPVLIVDDNQTSRHVLEEVLLSWNARPTAVADGPAALAAVREASERGEPFVLVLIDARMPVMDGFALAERIAADPSLCCRLAMMLTSHSLAGDIARCQQLGITAHLTKPIRRRELLNAILVAAGKSAVGETLSAPRTVGISPVPNGASKHLNILVTDDNIFNRKIASIMLERMGHAVAVAVDGREALAALTREFFDLVLMDVQMPVMDGLEATAAIRVSELISGDHLPIIALTAFAMQGDRERFLAAGFDGWLPKPIQSIDLSSAIDRLFSTNSRRPAKQDQPELAKRL